MNQNTAATIAAAGGRPPKVAPARRPETAFDKVRHNRRLAQHDALTARLLRKKRAEE